MFKFIWIGKDEMMPTVKFTGGKCYHEEVYDANGKQIVYRPFVVSKNHKAEIPLETVFVRGNERVSAKFESFDKKTGAIKYTGERMR